MIFSVILHVSEPQSNTDFTLELNALRAFPILDNTSSSVPPVMVTTLLKYLKEFTSSMSWLLIVIRFVIHSHDLCLASIDVIVVGWWQYWTVDWGTPINKLLKVFYPFVTLILSCCK